MPDLTDGQADTAHHLASFALSTKWYQAGLKRTVESWGSTRPKDYEALDDAEEDCGRFDGFWFVEVQNHRKGKTGQYGYSSEFELVVRVPTNVLSDDHPQYDLATEFCDDVKTNIRAAIKGAQSRSRFSAKEFLALVGKSNPDYGERQVADALDIAVGTLRGKLGRVQDKLDEARATLELNEEFDRLSDEDDTIQSYPAVLERIDEDDLPATALEHKPRREGERAYTVRPIGRDDEFDVSFEA